MSFAKTVTLDTKTIEFIESLMEELNIKNFSQALRIAVTYAKIYKVKTADREEKAVQLAALKIKLFDFEKLYFRNEKQLIKTHLILTSKWADKQKIAKLKEIL